MTDSNALYTFLILFAVIVIVVLVIGLQYIQFLRDRDIKQEKQRDGYFMKALFITLILALLILLGEFFGAFEKYTFKDNYVWFLILFGVLLLIFYAVDRASRPYSLIKCVNRAKLYAVEIWEARHKVEGFIVETEHLKVIGDYAFCYLRTNIKGVTRKIILKVDNRNLELAEAKHQPSEQQIDDIFFGKSNVKEFKDDEQEDETETKD